MHRSEITIDLGAVRRNVRRLRSVLDRTELWAVVKADGYGHGAVDVAGAALGEGARALCVATVAEALELRPEFPGVRILVMGPTQRPRDRAGPRSGSRPGRLERGDPGGRSRPPQARHGHGPLGAVRASRAARRGRRGDEPSGHGGFGQGVRAHADRALRAGNGRVPASDPSRREQRSRASSSRIPLRRGPLRGRDLRSLALRRAARHRPSRARAALGQPSRAGPAARPGREHGVRQALRRGGARPGWGSCPSAMRTGSGAT